MDTLRSLKNRITGAGTDTAPAGGAPQMGTSAAASAAAQGPPAVSTERPELNRVSTEYGEIEGQPFVPGHGIKRGPLSPRAQAVKDRLSKELEEATKVIG